MLAGYRRNMAPRPEDRAPPKSRVLPAGPRTSGEARWFLMEALKDQAVAVDAGAAALLTGELASNAARHGREPIGISVGIEGDGLRVSIHDQGAGFDPTDSGIRSSGWGMSLVEALASDWGVEHSEEGTEVWFKI
jgi:anti-sigma regulatory factor (Ser/Thr protein kinase)